LSAVSAAEPMLSIECGPGIGPSVSTSVLMWISLIRAIPGIDDPPN